MAKDEALKELEQFIEENKEAIDKHVAITSKVLETLKPGESVKVECAFCGGKRTIGKAACNGHIRNVCSCNIFNLVQ